MTDTQVKTPEELGALVRSRRKEQKLTQEDLAAVSLVTPRLLREVERGKRTAQLDGVLRILGALGIDLFARPR
jgi:HTH-type transcriptional regulator / antitoxin HipB